MEQLQPEANVDEYPAAFKSIRGAKSFWSLLIVLAILTHLTAFVLVDLVGILDDQSPASGAASSAPSKAETGRTDFTKACKTIFNEAMPAMKFLAPISCAIAHSRRRGDLTYQTSSTQACCIR